jgi:hypothetical protein
MRAIVCLLGVVAVCLSAASGSAEDRPYDPSRDKGFQISEERLVAALNHDALIRGMRVRVKIASRDLADDGKRDVVDYGFGGCPGVLGSVDHKSRNVLSFNITADSDCMGAHPERFLFASYAAMRSLGAASSQEEASRLVSEVLEEMKTDTSDTKSGIATANGRTVQVITPPSGVGLILKIYPTSSDTSKPAAAVAGKDELRAKAGQPFCNEKDKLQEFLLALMQNNDRWLRELKDECMGLPEGAQMAVIENYSSDSTIGHVSKVRVFAPKKGSMVGYTLVISPANGSR